ncbi:MAG: hypothetical protein JWQ64_415 [Subtercola sp.]|nr:hypothetical protein [Subtercola sp.]
MQFRIDLVREATLDEVVAVVYVANLPQPNPTRTATAIDTEKTVRTHHCDSQMFRTDTEIETKPS